MMTIFLNEIIRYKHRKINILTFNFHKCKQTNKKTEVDKI